MKQIQNLSNIMGLQYQKVRGGKRYDASPHFLRYCWYFRGHGGRVVTLSPPTSEIGVRFPARPQVGKLVVACLVQQFTVQNPDELYVLFPLPIKLPIVI